MRLSVFQINAFARYPLHRVSRASCRVPNDLPNDARYRALRKTPAVASATDGEDAADASAACPPQIEWFPQMPRAWTTSHLPKLAVEISREIAAYELSPCSFIFERPAPSGASCV